MLAGIRLRFYTIMKKNQKLKITASFISLLFCIALHDLSADERRVLILYKERDAYHQDSIDYVGKAVVKAGYRWDSRDVERLLAGGEKVDLSRYRGIVTCYLSTKMIGAERYTRFLLDQMEAGRKIIIIGSYGAYQGMIPKADGTYLEWNESTIAINTFFWPFGLEFLFGWTNVNKKLRITRIVPAMAEYETRLSQRDLDYFQYFRSVNPANKVYLELERTDILDSKSAVVVHTPFGGMVLEDFIRVWDKRSRRMKQRVNLVRFIREGLAGKTPPVPTYDLKTHRQLVDENPIPPLPAAPKIEIARDEVKRRLLVLYKKSEAPSLEEHPLFDRAGIALNYLGLICDYRAVEDGLPDGAEMEKYRGIVTWHTTPFMVHAREYNAWMLRQIKAGVKVVILENYGAYFDRDTLVEAHNVAPVFAALGIKHEKLTLARAEYLPGVVTLDKSMIGFEYKPQLDYLEYTHKYLATDPADHVYLALDDRYSGRIDLVVTNDRGGVAMDNSPFYFPYKDMGRIERIHKSLAGKLQYEVAEGSTIGQWIVNPYLFFTKALDLRFPVPDYTTLCGSRMFYIHIDGDALESISLIDGTNYAGKYVLEKHFRPYGDLPFSASTISLLLENNGNKYYNPFLELAREIYRLPNVEIASHTTTHPFNWVRGDPYIVNPDSYPWQIAYQPQDYVYELWGTKLFIDRYAAPPGKKLKIVLWSGECNPNAEALETAARAGLENLNGGDPIFDSEHPSIAGLCPLSNPQGKFRQFYTSAQNDYIYSLFLTGDWGGQKKVLDHYRKTENPYRIVPMNLYYHYYAGIKWESINACITVFKYFRAGNFAGVFASDYVKIAKDFYATRVRKDGDAYFFENDGNLRTIRFAAETYPDLEKSKGVIGFLWHGGQTYFHLDGTKQYKLVFSDAKPDVPYLRQSTMKAGLLKRNGDGISLAFEGFGKGYFNFGGLRPKRAYRLSIVDRNDAPVFTKVLSAGADGTAGFTKMFPAPPGRYQLRLAVK